MKTCPPQQEGPRTLIQALPDLALGLIGVATGLSVQNIASIIEEEWLGWGHTPEIESLKLLLFVLGFYGLYGIGILLVFETARDETCAEPAWQKYLATRGLAVAALSAFAVAYIGFAPTLYSKLAGGDHQRFERLYLFPIVLSFYIPVLMLMVPSDLVLTHILWDSTARERLREHIQYCITCRYPDMLFAYTVLMLFFGLLAPVNPSGILELLGGQR